MEKILRWQFFEISLDNFLVIFYNFTMHCNVYYNDMFYGFVKENASWRIDTSLYVCVVAVSECAVTTQKAGAEARSFLQLNNLHRQSSRAAEGLAL